MGSFSGPNAGARAAHAEGILVEGNFTPTEAGRAAEPGRSFPRGKTGAGVVRFSNFAGVPTIPDGDPNASPRGIAIKFLLPDGGDTDIVAHSYNGFPAATPEDLLGFLQAVAARSVRHPAVPGDASGREDVRRGPADAGQRSRPRLLWRELVPLHQQRRHQPLRPLSARMPVGRSGLSRQAAAAAAAAGLSGRRYGRARLRKQPVQFRLMVELAAPGDAVNDGSIG